MVSEQEFFLLFRIKEWGIKHGFHLSWMIFDDDVSRVYFYTSLGSFCFAIKVSADDELDVCRLISTHSRAWSQNCGLQSLKLNGSRCLVMGVSQLVARVSWEFWYTWAQNRYSVMWMTLIGCNLVSPSFSMLLLYWLWIPYKLVEETCAWRVVQHGCFLSCNTVPCVILALGCGRVRVSSIRLRLLSPGLIFRCLQPLSISNLLQVMLSPL